MRVIEIREPGGPEVLQLADRPIPECGSDDILIEVKAAGVNRPDVQQRRGLYPPPPGASDLPGLDVAGIVSAVGANVSRWSVGDHVCALANGGGYAEFCSVPALQAMPMPDGFDFVRAASLPEVFFTAWNNIVWLGELKNGETLLIQGGTSGVGMAATQIAKVLFDATVAATAGSQEKRQVCRDIGADAAFDYHEENWAEQVREWAGPEGLDIVLDGQAGPYTQMQLSLLGFDGRLVLIASHLGEFSKVNVRQLVRRRLTLTGSTLRPRDATYKGRIADELVEKVWPLLASGEIVTRIHSVYDFTEVRKAHETLDANRQIGKVVLAL